MKNFILLFLFAFIGWSSFVFAQAPQLINYQAVARNTSGQLIMNQNVSVRISILSGSATGTTEYSETHAVTTNQFGIFNIQIGVGTVVSGIFTQISWSSADHFVKVEADETGGTNYQLLGTSQLISVPYALYAEKSGDGFSGNYNDLSNKPTLFDGNYNSLINTPTLFSGAWGDLTGKPTFATVATSGSYDDLLNKPTLFDSTWSSITGKPTTLAGYGITDAMSILHVANGITSTNITNWNTAYTWGNHATAGYLMNFTEQDTMLWKKNGNDSYYKNGNVGIGSASPSVILDVQKGGTGQIEVGRFMGGDNAAGNSGLIYVGTTHTVGGIAVFQDSTSGNANQMAFYTQNTAGIFGEKMRISSTGNVGIGTSIPGNILHVDGGVGNTYISLTNNWSGHSISDGFVVGLANDGNSAVVWTYDSVPLRFGTAYNERMRITNNGNVGIGTINPISTFHVFGNGNGIVSVQRSVNAAMAGFAVMDNITGEKWGIGIRANEKKLRIFEDGDSNNARLTIDEGGNVGIGTVSPGYKLDVAGTMNAQEIRVNGIVLNPGTGSNWSVSGFDIYRLSGNVGIGTVTPTSNFHITGNGAYIKLEDTRTGNGAKTYSIGTSRVAYGDFAIIDESISATTARLYIQSGGNVGIGTTSPEALLTLEKNSTNDSIGMSGLFVRNSSRNAGIKVYSSISNNYHSVIQSTDYANSINTEGGTANSSYSLLLNPFGGNIGIGTENPDLNYKLHLKGAPASVKLEENNPNIRFMKDSTTFWDIGHWSYENNNFKIVYGIGNSKGIHIDTSGRVGVGTTTPSAKIEINGPGNNLYLTRIDGTENIGGFQLGIGAIGPLYHPKLGFNSLDASKTTILDDILLLDADGNVGIGTGDPKTTLHLKHRGNGRAVLRLEGQNTWDVNSWSTSNLIFTNISTVGDVMTLTSSGNLGIGTTNPVNKLHIHFDTPDTLRAFVIDDENGAQVVAVPTGAGVNNTYSHFGYNFYASSTSQLKYRGGQNPATGISFGSNVINLWSAPDATGGTNLVQDIRMTIKTTDGSVGIGTTIPNSKLEVNGDLGFTNGGKQQIIHLEVNSSSWTNTGINVGTPVSNSYSTSGSCHINVILKYYFAASPFYANEGMIIAGGSSLTVGTGSYQAEFRLDSSGNLQYRQASTDYVGATVFVWF